MPHSLLILACLSGSALGRAPLRYAPSSASVQAASAAWERGPEALSDWRAQRLHPGDEDGMQVVVELECGVHPDELLACIDQHMVGTWAELWVEPWLVDHAQVQLWVPWDELTALEACPEVLRVREPHRARPRYEMSEGYDAMFRQDWHAQGATGKGVEVAVLDVGFFGYDGLLGNELPSRVDTWEPSSASPSLLQGSTHGTAVAEIVHDIAPAADLDLYAFSTETEFLEAVQAIADSKAHIVNGSVGFDNIWHPDGTSPVTQAVDLLVSDFGKTWVAAAGNENQRYRIGALSNEAEDVVAIDGMSPVWISTSGGWAQVSLRWSEPMGQAAVDLDLLVYDEDGEPCDAQGWGQDYQDGDDHPYELVACHTGGNWAQAWVVANGHNVSGLEGYLYAYAGLDVADAAPERNLTLPGDTRFGISVGAVDLPVFDEVASYSSRGPTDYGQPRPHLVAPAGVSTASYGSSLFSGTSSAAPHVTGVAALVLQADHRSMEPAELRDFLTNAAIDIGPEGVDNASGAGFLSLDAVPWNGCRCAQAPTPPSRSSWMWVVLGCAVALLQRRRMG